MSSSFTTSIMNSGSLETSQAHTPLLSRAVPNIMSISTTSDLVINPYNSVALTSPVATSIVRGLIVISVATNNPLGSSWNTCSTSVVSCHQEFFQLRILIFNLELFYQSWPPSEGTIGGDGSGPSEGAFNSGLNQVERQMLPTMEELWYYQVESPSNGGPSVLPSCLAGGGGSLHGPP